MQWRLGFDAVGLLQISSRSLSLPHLVVKQLDNQVGLSLLDFSVNPAPRFYRSSVNISAWVIAG